MTKFLGNLIRWFCILILFAFVLLLCFLKAHGDAGKHGRFPDPSFTVNQNSYTMGFVRSVTVVRPDDHKIWTVVDFSPSYTPLLYPGDEMLFCGNVSEQFSGLNSTQEIVIVFGRAIEVMKLDGPRPNVFACHNLHIIRFVQKMGKEAQ